MGDMKEREKAVKKKQDSAELSRTKGNRFFKKGDYAAALEQYMEALKMLPYDAKTLTNIAQVSNTYILYIYTNILYILYIYIISICAQRTSRV